MNRLQNLMLKAHNEITRLKNPNPVIKKPFITDEEVLELEHLLSFEPDTRSTQAQSFNALKKDSIDYTVWAAIKNNQHTTRSRLCEITNIKINTLSGAVTRLLDSKYVEVSGTTYDGETNRNVQTLFAR